jgi:ectoine hydroxylase-related dioxygenase (phytanoyl-CoA dioxygenase family)
VNVKNELEHHGFSRIEGVLTSVEQSELSELVKPATGAGHRGLLRVPAIAKLAGSEKLVSLVRPHLPAEHSLVRAIFFNKSPTANWLVPWHQDLTIALQARADTPGFGPWSIKDGIPHVQPPVELLEQMLSVRLHLDDADQSNGALRVLPGSHRLGRLSADRIQQLRAERSELICGVTAGDAFLMRPLLLHSSSRSTSTRSRRVLHIEYAAFSLPVGLEWHDPEGG